MNNSGTRRILLLLRTPPPYGGGELRGAALRDYVADMPDFVVQEISSPKREKANQGKMRIWKVCEFAGNWWRFVRTVRSFRRPALVLAPLSKSFPHFLRDSAFFWTAKLLGVPFAGELPGSTFHFLGCGRVRTWYGKMVLTRLACLRVLGKSIAEELRRFGVANTIVTDNGVKPEGQGKGCTQSSRGLTRLLFVGAHSSAKGFDQLLEACARLDHKGLPFEVHTMGEWISAEFRREMLSLLHSGGLEGRFFFHGLKHGPDKWSVFANCQVLVLPSMMEGQPLVILEALATGMPVVASRVGAIPDTLEDGVNGFLVTPGAVSELTDRLEFLITNPEVRRRISGANRCLYQERFTEEAFLRTQVAWLRACASGRLVPRGQVFSWESAGNGERPPIGSPEL